MSLGRLNHPVFFVVTLVFAFSGFVAAGSAVFAVSYRIERIAAGLNQPTYVTQAPGDPANILYFTERTSNTIGGFSAINDMGKVWRYDAETRTKSLVLDLSNREVTNDTGLQAIAFSPDFNTLGAPTYGRMYVSSAERGATAVNRVEEYSMMEDGTFGFTRTILQYSNNAQNNHTVNWIGFDPTATDDERNYLYISAGDGSFMSGYNAGTSPSGRPSQNPSDVAGKILRVDVSSGDAYPEDPLKNFDIPASNPIPAYNAANPESPIMGLVRVGGTPVPAPGLGEVWATGVRNGYRASFDRATGDFYFGDVGEFNIEELDVVIAGTNSNGPPIDFGWPQREGMNASNVPGAPQTTTNPFTGVVATNPIRQYTHSVGLAIIGGYRYQGPIAELQGKYFYADFVGTGKTWMLDWDPATPPASYNGNNGAVTEMTGLWQSLVMDPTDPSYLASSGEFDVNGLDHIVSFGEDNAGNLYIVDFGNRSFDQNSFSGQYPHAGLGEIFRVTPLPASLGDYTGDGVVDGADYLEWKARYGESVAPYFSADGNGDGIVDAVDYTVWRNHVAVGEGGLGSIAQVPEPAALLSAPCLIIALLTQRRRRQQR